MENSKRSPRLRRQLRGVYLYEGACCLDITTAVWVALLAARGYSLWQIGLAEGVFHVVSLMAEIPSGMAADLLGRKRTLALSGVMAAVSGALMGFERGFGFVMAAMACSALSYNLISGTLQALTYDSLCEEKRTDLYPAVQARCAWLESAGALLGRLAGGLTAVLSFTRFYLVDVGLSFLRSAAALTPARTDRDRGPGGPAGGGRADAAAQPAAAAAGTCAGHRALFAAQPGRGPAAAGQRPDRRAELFDPDVFCSSGCGTRGVPTALLGLLICLFELGHPLGAWLSLRVRPPRLLALYAACAALAGGVHAGRRAGPAGAGAGGRLRVCRRGHAVDPVQRAAHERRIPQRPARDAGQRGQHDLQPADDPGCAAGRPGGRYHRPGRGRAGPAGPARCWPWARRPPQNFCCTSAGACGTINSKIVL